MAKGTESEPAWVARWREVEAARREGRALPEERLLAALGDDEAFVRLAALQAANARDRAARTGAEAAKDSDPRVHLAGAWLLGDSVADQALHGPARALGAPDPRDRLAAIQALAQLATPETIAHVATALRGPARALGAPDPRDRLAAIQALAQLATPETIAHVATALRDPEATVRLAAVQALVGVRGPEAIPHLVALLGDPDASLRLTAAQALAGLGAAAGGALPALRAAERKETDATARQAFRDALGAIQTALKNAPPEVRAALPEEGATTVLREAAAPDGSGLELKAAALAPAEPDRPRGRWRLFGRG